ncbi:hypothetical protein E2562_039329, partial [Oryza meyeriana var. granulata]
MVLDNSGSGSPLATGGCFCKKDPSSAWRQHSGGGGCSHLWAMCNRMTTQERSIPLGFACVSLSPSSETNSVKCYQSAMTMMIVYRRSRREREVVSATVILRSQGGRGGGVLGEAAR